MKSPIKSLIAATGPRRWLFLRRPIGQRRSAISELVYYASTEPSAAQEVNVLWNALLKEENNELLVELARQVGQKRITSATAEMMKCFSLKLLSNDTKGVREAVVDALCRIGVESVSIVVSKLLDSDPTVASWALVALRRIGLNKSGVALAECFSKSNTELQQKLVDRLSNVSQQSWEDVILLLAGLVKSQSPRQTLAEGILKSLDRKRLEQECMRFWMSRHSVAARSVLINFFDYDQSVLQ